MKDWQRDRGSNNRKLLSPFSSFLKPQHTYIWSSCINTDWTKLGFTKLWESMTLKQPTGLACKSFNLTHSSKHTFMHTYMHTFILKVMSLKCCNNVSRSNLICYLIILPVWAVCYCWLIHLRPGHVEGCSHRTPYCSHNRAMKEGGKLALVKELNIWRLQKLAVKHSWEQIEL